MGGAHRAQRRRGGVDAQRCRRGCPTRRPRCSARIRTPAFSPWTICRPSEFPLWKTELIAGLVDQDFAAAVGRDLASIHARSAAEPRLRAEFANDDTFEAIRIEPYLRATARAHPALAARFDALAATTLATKRALVHGDVSPKNILKGPRGPVFLDAECACFGDPAFDLAFCLNHLLLKGARARRRQGALSRRLCGAGERLSCRRRLGGGGGSRGPRRGAAAGFVPRQDRRQVAGRISDPRQRTRRRAPLRRSR